MAFSEGANDENKVGSTGNEGAEDGLENGGGLLKINVIITDIPTSNTIITTIA